MKIDLSGKVALVTGGSRGIGAATSIMLAEAGATVAINFVRNQKQALSLVKKIRKKRHLAFLVPGDVSDFLEAESVVNQVIDKTGRMDILVNNAGIWEPNPIDHPRAEVEWDKTLRINLKSLFNITTHCVPHIKKGKGRIINIASTAGQRGEAYYSHYATSKGGMIAFTKSLAVELAPHHVLVNAVSPGWVWTDMTIKYLSKPAHHKEALSEIPLGKFAQPEDVAGTVLFLSSALSSHITGAVINVNGGSVL